MIRTDRLRELGGFATDQRLDGWEHYDLLCRMAERGWPGQLVPQVLAGRQASTASVLTTSDPAAATAIMAMIERSPYVLAGVLPPI